jgi:hypothetical protein
VLGLFLALLDLFILLLSCCLTLIAIMLIAEGGGELCLCWVFAMAHVRSTAGPISDVATGGAGDGGDNSEEMIISARLSDACWHS